MSENEEKVMEKRRLIVSTNNLGASHVYREKESESSTDERVERREVKPVVKYEPKKETFGSKLKKAIFGTKEIDNIPEYLVLNVAVPALKQTFFDMFVGGIGMAFGINYDRKRKSGDGYTGFFRSDSRRSVDDDDDIDDRRPSSYRDIGFYNEADAYDVYKEMFTYVREQGYVTVAEYYGISDRDCPDVRNFDRKGWDEDDLRDRRIYKSRGRWYIDLPRPQLVSSMRGRD